MRLFLRHRYYPAGSERPPANRWRSPLFDCDASLRWNSLLERDRAELVLTVLVDPDQGLWHLSCRFSTESKPDVIVEPVVITDPRYQIGPVGRLQQLPTDVPRAQRSMEPNKRGVSAVRRRPREERTAPHPLVNDLTVAMAGRLTCLEEEGEARGVERLACDPLAENVCHHHRVAMDRESLLPGNLIVRGQPTKAETAETKGLGQTVRHDRPFIMVDRGRRERTIPFEPAVDLVRQKIRPVIRDHLDDRGHLLVTERRAGGVIRVIEIDQLGARTEQSSQFVRIRFPPVLRTQRQDFHRCA